MKIIIIVEIKKEIKKKSLMNNILKYFKNKINIIFYYLFNKYFLFLNQDYYIPVGMGHPYYSY